MSRHPLKNGLTLEFWDYSRPIAGDCWFVLLEVRIAIPIKLDTLPPELQGQADRVKETLGDEIILSQKTERNFIAALEAPKILQALQASFLDMAPRYFGIPILPPGSSEGNSPKSKNCSAGRLVPWIPDRTTIPTAAPP